MEISDPTPVLIAIVAAIWLLFIALYVLPVVRYRRRRQRGIAWLKAHGWRISVIVERVETQPGPRLGSAGAGLARHIIVARSWDDPQGGQSYTFASDPLRGSVADDLPGAEVDVLIDPDNPHRYWMDAESLR